MAKDLNALIDTHLARFGELDLTLATINLTDPEVNDALVEAIQDALDSGEPVSEDSVKINLTVPEGTLA